MSLTSLSIEKASTLPDPNAGVATRDQGSPSPMRRLGTSGYVVTGGFVMDRERNASLAGSMKYVTYSDILANTSVVAAGVRFYLNLVAKAQFKIHPADDSEEAEAVAELMQESIDKCSTPWSRVVKRGAMYRFYGFAVQEWVAKRLKSNGKIIMGEVGALPQFTVYRWDTDPVGNVRGIVQFDPQSQTEIYVPRSKLIYVTDDTMSASPEGLGIFRHLVEPAQRLARYEQLEDFGFETDLRGIPIVKAPLTELREEVISGKISEDQRDALLAPFREFLQNHWKNPQLGMLLDSEPYRGTDAQAIPLGGPQYEMNIVQGQSTGQNEIARSIERINREIARVLGTEHLLLGDGEGSQALSRDKSQNFAAMIDGSLIEVADSLKRDYITPLMKLNGYSEELTPNIRAEQVRFREVEQITAALKDMSAAGVILAPNDPAINEIRELLGLSSAPEMDIEEMAMMQGQLNGTLQPDGSPIVPPSPDKRPGSGADKRKGSWSGARKQAHAERMRKWARERAKLTEALKMKE